MKTLAVTGIKALQQWPRETVDMVAQSRVDATAQSRWAIRMTCLWQNGCKESFNSTLEDEVLKREIFNSLEEARFIIEMWRKEVHRIRPHSSLGYRSPAPEAVAT